MKKIVSMMLGMILILASCHKENPFGKIGEETTVTILTKVPETGFKTKSNPDGLTYYLEVYYNGAIYGEQEISSTGSFDLRLVTGKPYTIVCWADYDNGTDRDYYNTTNGLTAIAINGNQYAGNDKYRDAFVGVVEKTLTSGESITLTMKRPFGQVNVRTNDLSDVKAPLIPTKVGIAYKNIPTVLNALTGALSGNKAMTFTVSDFGADATTANQIAAGWVSFDYIFAPATGSGATIDFTMSFYKEDGTTLITANDQLVSIPVKANFRTNVSGYLITKRGAVVCDIHAIYETPNYQNDIVEVSSVAEVADLLNAATSNTAPLAVVVTQPVSTSATIAVPDAVNTTNTPSLSFAFPAGVSSGTLTIKDENPTDPSNNFTGPVYINIPESSTASVVINMPGATVYINGTKISAATTATAQNTFVVGKDSEVTGTLTVNGGNVDIYGKVNTIVRGASNKDIQTIVNVFPGGTLTNIPSDVKIVVKNIVPGIRNITTGKSYATVYDAVRAAQENETIEISEGEYPYLSGKANADFKWSLPITTNGLTIRGVGNVILYGGLNLSVFPGNMDYTISSIMVKAANVTLENLTIKPQTIKYNNGAGYGINKTIELTTTYTTMPTKNTNVDNFKVINCKFIANGDERLIDQDGGAIYVGGGSTTEINGLVIDGCVFEAAGLSLQSNVVGAIVKNTVFNGIRTVWNISMGVRGTATIEKSTFNVNEGENAIEARGTSVVNLNNCTFPTAKNTYWMEFDTAKIIINGL